ncbi:SDR family oxidoreductase [Sphingomonadaceae bacterium OTU29LAMAA1]|nr:SDR family oxidoreductase [Sphingomonadaceae bacterium OTU29LAMAA1]
MKSMLKPLSEQVIVITGASSGIGLETAQSAARQGAKVVLVARDGEALQSIVAEITAAGGTADFHAADVGDPEAVRAAASHAVQRFGRIDTWVNNAGSAIYGKLLDVPDDEHRQLFRTNYFGMVHGCRAAVPHLRDAGGALITIGSIASDMPSPLMGAYAATKHAAKAYVDTLRMELATEGVPIVVTLVKPSGIDTPVAQHAINHAGGEAQVPPPVYDPKLVADAILFCATHPKRDLTVGGAGRAQALFAAHFPHLFDRLAPKAAASFVDPTKEQPGPGNLFASTATGRVRSGEHPAARTTSLYTAAAKHPGITAAVAATIAAGVGAFVYGHPSRDPDRPARIGRQGDRA